MNFLKDACEYDRAVAYWDKLVISVLKENFNQDEWHKWLNTKFVDGSSDCKANPITSFVSKPKLRGIKIIQLENVQSDEIDASVRVFASGDPEEEISYLEICCFLTPETAEFSKLLIEKWVNSDDASLSMDVLVRRLCSKRNKELGGRKIGGCS